MAGVKKDEATSLLFQYSEWLDGQSMITEGDETHEEMVDLFLAQRSAEASPEISA